jgi:hypothetical protein
VSSWTSTLQELAGLDPDDFDPAAASDEELREFLPLVQIGINRLSAVLTRSVAAGESRQVQQADGMVSMKAWLTGHCRLSGREAAGLVRDGRRLAELPILAAAYSSGELTAAHVATVTTAVTPARIAVAAANGIDLTTTDAVLAEAALALGPEDTAKAVRHWVAGIDPDGALDDAAGMQRVLRMAVSADGRIYVTGHLDAVGGETVHSALESLMNADRPAGDTRTYGQRMGDAFVQLARQALRSGELPTVRGEAAQVRVSIDLMALCADRAAVGVAGGELPFAGPITPETARRLACDAGVVRIITGPHGLPMDVGREQRTATAAIRRSIEVRDVHCVFAGCTAPASWCDVHHVQHWVYGGPTSCENGALLCERHHTAVHEGGFEVARDPGTAIWHTYRADGTEILPRAPRYPLRL